ncbi:MAG TPA: septum formation protein Maf [Bacteroidetes bacterium]|nr:septum formation protein Maf [Bacteroidota bacterium]
MKKIILGSASPRRKELLKMLGLSFEVRPKDIDESYSDSIKGKDVALYLAEKKLRAFKDELKDNELIITADTIVCLENEILGKPQNAMDAKIMLSALSGKTHSVVTGCGLMSKDVTELFYEKTEVVFRELSDEEIDHYIANYKPYDKAGAYAIQEWIGMAAIEKINGCYYNVVGLPLSRLYMYLKPYIKLDKT